MWSTILIENAASVLVESNGKVKVSPRTVPNTLFNHMLSLIDDTFRNLFCYFPARFADRL